MTPQTEQRLFDIQAAVAYLRSLGAESATANFVRGLISSGQIKFLRLGRKFYLSRTELDLWVEKAATRMR